MADVTALIARPPAFDYNQLADPLAGYAQGRALNRQLSAQEAMSGGLPKTPDGQIDWPRATALIADTQARYGNLNDVSKLAQAQQSNFYGTPIYGTDEQGNAVIGTFNKQGQFKRIDTGGVTVTPGIKTIDTGTGTLIVGSRSGVPIGQPTQPAQRPAGPPPGFAPPAIDPNSEGIPPSQAARVNAPQVGSTAPMQPTPVQTQQYLRPGQNPAFVPKDVQGEAREGVIGRETGEKIANMGKAQQARDTVVDGLQRLRDAVVALKNDPGLVGNVGVQGVFPNFPGGRAADAFANLNTIQSQMSGVVLQAMRDASKTGGAVGQVTEKEWPRLENMVAALSSLRQSETAYKRHLDNIVKYADGAIGRVNRAFEQDYGALQRRTQPSQPAAASSQPQAVQPPMEGARQAPDGNWYVERDGKFFRVEP